MLRHHIKLLFLNMTHAQRKILIQKDLPYFFIARDSVKITIIYFIHFF